MKRLTLTLITAYLLGLVAPVMLEASARLDRNGGLWLRAQPCEVGGFFCDGGGGPAEPPCRDNDQDGYMQRSGCGTAVDCNDADPTIHPDAQEVCGDWIDQDCNGSDYGCFSTRKLQGVADFHIDAGFDSEEIDPRYQRMVNDLNIGYATYNIFWKNIDRDDSPDPFNFLCSPVFNHIRVPVDEAERTAKGYNTFHCYYLPEIEKFDAWLSKDLEHGIESAAVLWASPIKYQDPGCLGGEINKDGCVPRADAMDDFEDYVNFLADRYSGSNPNYGKIKHWTIWNEVGFGGWFDYSPVIPRLDDPDRVFGQEHIDQWLDKYEEMMRDAHEAITRHITDFNIYVAIDGLWTLPPGEYAVHSGDIIPHISSKRVVDGMWDRLGTSINWSIHTHPYGLPTERNPVLGNATSFHNLAKLHELVAYQEDKLRELGFQDPLTQPQSHLWLGEQGWNLPPTTANTALKAQYICEAHDIVTGIANINGVVHYYFHTVPWDYDAGNPDSPTFGLLPRYVSNTLDNADGVPTWEAYRSTNSDTWGILDNHYCNQFFGEGGILRNDQRPIGSLDVADSHQISGWTFDWDTPRWPLKVHLYFDSLPGQPGAKVVEVLANRYRPDVFDVHGGKIGDWHGYSYEPCDFLKQHFNSGEDVTIRAYAIDALEGPNPQLTNELTFTITPECGN